jgi:hypothetical protein
VQAKLLLERTRGLREITFDDLQLSKGKETVELLMSNAAGDQVRPSVPKAQLKKLVSWKLLTSL